MNSIVILSLARLKDLSAATLPQDVLDRNVDATVRTLGISRHVVMPALGQVAEALRLRNIEYVVDTPTIRNEALRGNNPLTIRRDLS